MLESALLVAIFLDLATRVNTLLCSHSRVKALTTDGFPLTSLPFLAGWAGCLHQHGPYVLRDAGERPPDGHIPGLC